MAKNEHQIKRNKKNKLKWNNPMSLKKETKLY